MLSMTFLLAKYLCVFQKSLENYYRWKVTKAREIGHISKSAYTYRHLFISNNWKEREKKPYLHIYTAAINPEIASFFRDYMLLLFFISRLIGEGSRFSFPRVTLFLRNPSVFSPPVSRRVYHRWSQNAISFRDSPRFSPMNLIVRPDHPSFVYADARDSASTARKESNSILLGSMLREDWCTRGTLPLPRSLDGRDGLANSPVRGGWWYDTTLAHIRLATS